MRPQDTVADQGEEFVILLPDTGICRRRKALQRLQRELLKSSSSRQPELLMTFSAGVTLHRADDNQATVTKRADEAMYQAKKSGKNRVVSVPRMARSRNMEAGLHFDRSRADIS